jgi:hypothetical protein
MSEPKFISQYDAHNRVLKRVYDHSDNSAHYDVKGCLRGGYTTRTKMPDTHHMMSFDVVATRKASPGRATATTLKFLVLDNYGNGDGEAPLSSEFEDVIFGLAGAEQDYTLAINRETGQCYKATFAVDGDDLILFLNDNSAMNDKGLPRVPKAFLPQLDALKNKQRPFDLSLPKGLLMDYIERRTGTNEFPENVIVSLHLSGSRIKITNIEIAPDGTQKRTPATGLHGEPTPTDVPQWLELHGDHYRIVSGWEDSGRDYELRT